MKKRRDKFRSCPRKDNLGIQKKYTKERRKMRMNRKSQEKEQKK